MEAYVRCHAAVAPAADGARVEARPGHNCMLMPRRRCHAATQMLADRMSTTTGAMSAGLTAAPERDNRAAAAAAGPEAASMAQIDTK